MSTKTDNIASSEKASSGRQKNGHDGYDADDESDPEPTTLEDALEFMQKRIRSSGPSTTDAEHRHQLLRSVPPEAFGNHEYGSGIAWTGTIVDMRCSEPERLWKSTYNTSECAGPRDLSPRPPVSREGMPSDARVKSSSSPPVQKRAGAPPGNEQRWRAEIK